MRKILLSTALFGLMSFPALAEEQTYGVLMKTLANPFWGAMELGVKDGAAAAGVNYVLQAVESDQAAEPQLNPKQNKNHG